MERCHYDHSEKTLSYREMQRCKKNQTGGVNTTSVYVSEQGELVVHRSQT